MINKSTSLSRPRRYDSKWHGFSAVSVVHDGDGGDDDGGVQKTEYPVQRLMQAPVLECFHECGVCCRALLLDLSIAIISDAMMEMLSCCRTKSTPFLSLLRLADRTFS